MALIKDLKLTESKELQFRAEFFNIFNHAQFQGPVGNFLSSDFGFVTKANDGRIGQVAVKFTF
jgi:methionyl-tRNA synthetase